MAKFVPKEFADTPWLPLTPQRDYAIRANPDETAGFRFGPVQGIYMAIAPAPSGRLIFGVEYETGEQSLLARMPDGQPILVGRISDCLVKIMHAIVSRHHAELKLDGNVVILRDLGSTNGTFLAPGTPHFDIQKYKDSIAGEAPEERTLDAVHEQFGPAIDDFLSNYTPHKEDPK